MTKAAKGAVLRAGERPPISRQGGSSTVQMVTPGVGFQAFLNGFTDIPPGAAIPFQFRGCEEGVLIVAGEAKVEIDGDVELAVASDVTWLPSGVPDRFINPSKVATLRIFWTYSSVSATRTLVETGMKAAILAEGAGTKTCR